MTPYYQDRHVTIYHGDARHLPLPDGTVDLIVTSPPYWALRSYTDGGEHYAGQIGAEPTPGEYVDNLIACTREWMRVLKPCGSVWINLGDKYNSAASGQNGTGATTLDPARGPKMYNGGERGTTTQAVRPKSLVGLPWRYALRCIDELGLILRAEVIWSKPNGLPESVQDRVRRSHEQWFHMVQQPRYFSAVDEIRETYSPNTHDRRRDGAGTGWAGALVAAGSRRDSGLGGKPNVDDPRGKLPGSVWTIPTEPLSVPDHLGVDHFAAFPTEWPRRTILGWSPSGICTACGQGRRPVVDRRPMPADLKSVPHRAGTMLDASRGDAGRTNSGQEFNRWRAANPGSITGEACACPDTTAPTRPAVVLDPFGGTGTTSLVARALGRTGISVDMSADYCRLAQWRTTDPGELARAMRVDKPEPVAAGQMSLLDEIGPGPWT